MSTPTTADSIGGYKIGHRVYLVKNAGAFDGASGTVIGLDIPHGWRVWVHPEGASAGVALYMDPDDLERTNPSDDIDARIEEQGKRIGEALTRSLGVKPAPLDPSKVKAGDTAEVEVELYAGPKCTVAGEVRQVGASLWIGPICITLATDEIAKITLTGHQPAPEPEPEWKAGTTGTATLNNHVSGNSAVGLRAMRTERDGVFGFALETGLTITDEATTWSVSDFVPDSTETTLRVTKAVTREEMADALARHYGDHESLAAVGEPSTRQNYLDDADAVLGLLGGAS